MASASSFFSLLFSSSSAFRRLASETSMPPYLAFQLYSVASDTPCLRARSAVLAPLMLLQHTDNHLFREPCALHLSVLHEAGL
jgi:hypothetical protein